MIIGRTREGADQPNGLDDLILLKNSFTEIIEIDTESSNNSIFHLPLYLTKVAAGFPSPAEDYLAKKLDLNEYLIKRPAATFLVRANGNSMINAGIHDNDLLVIDRSCKPTSGKIVIAAINGELTVKRLHKKSDGKFILKAENPNHPSIEVNEDSDVHIWGVVTYVIHAT